MDSEIIEVTQTVAKVFTECGVRYYLCGSMASSLRGVARATMDVDFVADLSQAVVPRLVAEFQKQFDVDEEMIREAVSKRKSFNIIHSTYVVKVDVFINKASAYDEEAFRKSTLVPIENTAIQVASAEDTVLSKMAWYRLGGEVSDRQWSDILGVLRLQSTGLDQAYLRHWAQFLRVEDLLEKAVVDSK